MKILVVDDEQLIRLTAEKALSNAGHDVVVTGSGKGALIALSEQTFDVILLDYELPDINGLNITRLLHSNPELKSIPIILMSAHNKLELIQQAYDAGIILFLHKKETLFKDLSSFVTTYTQLNKFNGAINE